ncbi:MAG TPA: hypothetical protein VNN25_16215, partial [Thermoanaerobaculia bacterium]|nr:hypothetical protein [Thermoanaerobaculia bacterium]
YYTQFISEAALDAVVPQRPAMNGEIQPTYFEAALVAPLAPSAAAAPAATEVNIAQRANEIQSTLSAATQTRTTTAVAQVANPNGSTQLLVGSSERVLRPAQLAALRDGETAVSGQGHAEATVISAAHANGQTVQAVAASRPICPSCAGLISQAGATAASALKQVIDVALRMVLP